MGKIKKPVGFFEEQVSRNLETEEKTSLGTEESSIIVTNEPINIEALEPTDKDIVCSSNVESKESINEEIKDSINLEIKASNPTDTNVSRNLENEESSIIKTKEPKRRQNISKQVPNSKGLINQGFMMDEELIAVLAFYAVMQNGEERDKSTVVRNALRSYIPEKYFKRYKEQMENEE